MNKDPSETTHGRNRVPDACFWESQLYPSSYFKRLKKRAFRYYDNFNVFNYLFFKWISRWFVLLSQQYVEPYRLHPLPVADQALRWQPVFSKHLSDGLVRLEAYHTAKALGTGAKVKKPPRSILLRALILTVWRRALLLFFGLVAVNVLSMNISILVKRLLALLTEKSFNFLNTALLLTAIIGCQVADGLFTENINYCVWRMIILSDYLISSSIYVHSLSHRRRFFNNINGSNPLNVCNQVLHCCAPGSECSKNPLFCQALRHQGRDISSRIFNLQFSDSVCISLLFRCLGFLVEFFVSCGYGIYLISVEVKANLWVLYAFVGLFIVSTIILQVLNVCVRNCVLHLRDRRIDKCNHIIPSLPLIKKLFYDDIAINILAAARNLELTLDGLFIFTSCQTNTLYFACLSISFLIIQRSFVATVANAPDITAVDTAGFMTSFYIFLRLIISMFLVPLSLDILGISLVGTLRMERFMRECSPNFYISDNKYTGVVKTSSNIANVTNQIPKDTVVYYKDASFTWVNSRNDLLNNKYEVYLTNINFQLKRGEMVVVLGSQGSGKSNFIKSMLGEMTLAGGSMAVVPLYTSMPIFYASQDIWLQHGTIRSNITFGYKFDEDLYNQVLKAVELEFDISTWESGDLRVVSDNAHSLSGGQRVRMEMARAVYAYLVFHKVNVEYNNSQCSFLMCLDSSFHGLDPYVSKTVFNNLFNQKTGLLVKGDLSVVLTSSKQSLDTCLKGSSLGELPNPPVYNVKRQRLGFYCSLHDFAKNKRHSRDEHTYLSSAADGQRELNRLSEEMLKLCSSGSTSRAGRAEQTVEKYSSSFKNFVKEKLANTKFSSYGTYFAPAMTGFVLYILVTAVVIVLDNLNLLVVTNLADYISAAIADVKEGRSRDVAQVKQHATFSLTITTVIVASIVAMAFLSGALMTASSVSASRKIVEYAFSSIFYNSSWAVRIKRQVSQMMTFFTCDSNLLDEDIVHFLKLTIFSVVHALINLAMNFYLVPISIPFYLIVLFLLVRYTLCRLVRSNRNVNFGMLESFLHINSVCENAISGSSTYRSFRREAELSGVFEHMDYKARCHLMGATNISYSIILFNWAISTSTLLVLVLSLVFDRFTSYKLRASYFGLALSLCMNQIKTFNFFSPSFAHLEMSMCAVHRFRYFVPPGQKLKFDKCINTHEEYIVKPSNRTITDADRKQLLKRRAVEFRADNRRFYLLRRMFYHPKITILDVGQYLTRDHSGVQLNDVCVFTSEERNPDFMILKNITVSAQKSDIIGMVGRTGAGKTTLLSVLQNLAENRTGQVLLDGKDLNDIPKDVLRQIIGVLPQLPFVFKGWTIRRFLDPRKLFTDDDINRALDQCGLLRFVNELPGGKRLDTVILVDDINLSHTDEDPPQYKRPSYEKERSMSIDQVKVSCESDMILSYNQLRTLWLARLVLYRHFYRMIIVDEPPEEDLEDKTTSKNDDLGVPIYELLQKYFSHCTTFVTAHDANVLKTCTNVWVIHDGCLIRTCKTSDIAANESIANIIEESVK